MISYINQDTSFLRGSLTDFCRKRNLDESLLFALLRQLDMERVQFLKPMEDFSEGQKKKVLIEKLILKYCPTMLLVNHDICFREKIATRVIKW